MTFRELLFLLVGSSKIAVSIASHEVVIGPKGRTTIITSDDTPDVNGKQYKETTPDDAICTLYLAPSAIPGAGLGVFTGMDFEEGDAIAWAGISKKGDKSWFQDILIPILDKYKTLPYRGNQRFLSWLGYVWTAEIDMYYHSYHDGSYPTVPAAHYTTPVGLNGADLGLHYFYLSEKYDGDQIPINVFAPGIASLVNSHFDWANVALDPDESITLNAETGDDDEEEMRSPLDQAKESSYSKLAPGSGFIAQTDIDAGSELFIYYGHEWHHRYDEKVESQKLESENSQKDVPYHDTLESYWDEIDFNLLPSEQDKRDKEKIMNIKTAERKPKIDQVEEKRRLHVEKTLQSMTLNTKNDNVSQDDKPPVIESYVHPKVQSRTETGITRKDKKVPKEHDHDEDEEKDDDNDDEEPPRRDIEWLKHNGACLDNLKVHMSTIPGAGRGAFANRFIPKGTSIAPAPLLALKRKDLILYETNDDAKRYQHTLNMKNVIGQELLLNYCYGHPESDLLLVPYTPVVNFINHHADIDRVNAEIRWPSNERAQALIQRIPQDWLETHPLDVTDQSGELLMEFVALRNIHPGEEIFVNYGTLWQEAWDKHSSSSENNIPFRHEIGVPEGFYPPNWLNQLMEYEVEPIENLQPGEIRQFTWKHNGKPVAKSAFVVGLPQNFTTYMREFAEVRGIMNTYEQLLAEKILGSDEWYVFNADQHNIDPEQWFALRYKSVDWDFNMHYVAAWNDNARKSVYRAFGSAGYDIVLDSIGRYFGLDSLTCFHTSFMGVSEADKSFIHTDIYATGEVGYNIIFPIVTVDGSKPELDIQSDNANVVVAVKYEHDRAVLMPDWGYHRTSAVDYEEKGQIRVVMGMYCAQIDESNHNVLRFIYNGEDPAPFIDQFNLPIKEIHWDKDGQHHLPR